MSDPKKYYRILVKGENTEFNPGGVNGTIKEFGVKIKYK